MVHKLLVLVLCLLALSPQRVCTCAAAATPCTDPACATGPADGGCTCDDHGADDQTAVPVPLDSHRHSHQHDDDCLTVKPVFHWQASETVSVDQPVPAAVALDPIGPGSGPAALPSPPPASESPPGRLPVYLSTLRLRN